MGIEHGKRDLKIKETHGEQFLIKAEQKSCSEYVKPSGTVLQLNAKLKLIREARMKSSKVVAEREMLLLEYKELKTHYDAQKRKLDTIEEHVKLMEDMNQARS